MAVSVKELPILMKKRLNEVPGEPFEDSFTTIFRLPGWIHEVNKELCEPSVVAIGPYHHGKESLRTVEEHKWSILRDFLARYENVDLEDFLDTMRGIEAHTRRCYSEPVNMTSDEFVMMMLLDGCFILELFLRPEYYQSDQVDAICGAGWAENQIGSDMFLLENQLPFLVIHDLFALATRETDIGCDKNCNSHQCFLVHSWFKFCEGFTLIAPFKPPKISCSDIYHLLHLFYVSTVPDFQPEIVKKQGKLVPRRLDHFCGLGSFTWPKLFLKKSTAVLDSEFTPLGTNMVNIQCAADLYAAGIKFKRKEKPRNLLDISFQNGIIEMPYLLTQSISVALLWNLVAFEQSRLAWDFPQVMSSYLALMDALINTEKDVALLERFGIVSNLFENPEEAANFFNKFDRLFVLNYENHYFKSLFEDVREYSQSTWHSHRARLMQDYFSNPWTIISVVAACILLILTVLQTYFSAPS